MAEEFEGRDLKGAGFWGVDLTGGGSERRTHRRVREPRMARQRRHRSLVDRVVINGVDVTQFVTERDRWYPSRAMLRPPNPEGVRAAWGAPHEAWASTAERARALRDLALLE